MKPGTRPKKARAKTLWHAAVMTAVLMVIWLAWSGHYTPLLMSLGAASCLFVTALALRMNIVDKEGMPHHLGWRILKFTPYLIKEITIANIAVAREILRPVFRISPAIVSIQSQPKTELGTTILANCITLTPGTISVRVREGVILVHALTQEGAQETLDGGMNRRVAKLEGHE